MWEETTSIVVLKNGAYTGLAFTRTVPSEDAEKWFNAVPAWAVDRGAPGTPNAWEVANPPRKKVFGMRHEDDHASSSPRSGRQKSPSPSAAAAAARPVPDSVDLSDDFFAAPGWLGSRAGWEFRAGVLGQGYYRSMVCTMVRGCECDRCHRY